jgi:UDP:flavonoid glycosyltransferase YjiC (YdhE family)
MRVMFSTYGSRGDVEPMVGVAIKRGALGTTGVMPSGVWR